MGRLSARTARWGDADPAAAGKSPVDRGKQGTKRSLLTDGLGIPLGYVIAPANRHDSPHCAPRSRKLGWFGLDLPEQITVHLDAGYDNTKTRRLLDELGRLLRTAWRTHRWDTRPNRRP